MILRNLIATGTARLSAAGIEGSARDAARLAAHALALPPERVITEGNQTVSPTQAEAYQTFLTRRCEGEPVSRIVGGRHFWDHWFTITPDVLDPRPDTETLVAIALKHPAQTIADLGTGSGALAVTLAAQWPEAKVWASDISPAALKVARANAERILGAHATAITFVEANWFDTLPLPAGGFDLIVSNPPYITASEMNDLSTEVRQHDPAIALTPGGDGLSAYRAIARDLAKHLAPGGRFLAEIGWQQGPAVRALFEQAGFCAHIEKDLNQHDRVICATPRI